MKPQSITLAAGTGATSGMVRLDEWAYPSVVVQISATGSVNFDLQVSLDDPNNQSGFAVPVAGMTWSSTGAVGATGSALVQLPFVPLYARIRTASGTGSLTATFVQAGVGPG